MVCTYVCLNVGVFRVCDCIDHRMKELAIMEAEVVGACKASLCYHLVQVTHDKDGHVSAGS